MSDLPAAFWSWSLEAYGKPGVAESALALQDRDGANVNLLLLCAWCAAREARALDTETLAEIQGVGAPWADRVTSSLRTARRALKEIAHPRADAADALRTEVKRLELDAERLEQHLLVTVYARIGPADCAQSSAAHALECTLKAYARLLPAPAAESDRAARLQDFIKAVLV